MAGAIGVSPWSYTWGELSLMSEGRDDALWWHTAAIVSPIRSALGDRRSIAECHPYEQLRRKRSLSRPEMRDALEASNRAAWRAFCDTFKK